MSGRGPPEISELGWDYAGRWSLSEGSRAGANRAKRLRSVSCQALNVVADTDENGGRAQRQLRREEVSPEQSILSQRRGSDSYPELTHVANSFESMRFYREWP